MQLRFGVAYTWASLVARLVLTLCPSPDSKSLLVICPALSLSLLVWISVRVCVALSLYLVLSLHFRVAAAVSNYFYEVSLFLSLSAWVSVPLRLIIALSVLSGAEHLIRKQMCVCVFV